MLEEEKELVDTGSMMVKEELAQKLAEFSRVMVQGWYTLLLSHAQYGLHSCCL